LKKRLILITFYAVVLIVGIDLILRGSYFSGKIEGRLIAEARQSLGYEVGMERLVFNFFPTYIDVNKPYIKGWDKDDPKTALGAGKLRVYFSLPALIGKEIHISRIQVEGPTVSLKRLPGGGYNIDPLMDRLRKLAGGKEKAAGAYKLEVREVTVFNAGINYKDTANGIDAELTDGGVDFRLQREGVFRVGFNLKDITAKRGGMPPVRATAAGDVSYDNGKARLEGVRLSGEGAKLAIKGVVMWSKAPLLDLDVDAGADLNLLDRFAVWKDGPKGEAELKGAVKGTYPHLTGKGTLALRKVSYAGLDVDDIVSDIGFEKGALTLPSLKSRLLGGTVEGNLTVDMGGEVVSYRSSWRLKDIISGYYTRSSKALLFIPWHRVSGSVDIFGSGLNASALQAAGSVDLARYEAPHFASGVSSELDIIKAVHVEFGLKDGNISVDKGMVSTKATVVDFTGAVKLTGESDLVIKGRSSDISEISTMIGYSDMKGNLDVTAYMRGNIVEPDIMGKAHISGASVHGIPFQSADGDVRLNNWRLSASDFVINHDKGSLLLNGAILFKGEGADFYHPVFHAKLGVRDILAKRIIGIFYKEIPVNVAADGDIRFDGTLEKFAGSARLDVGAGDVYGQKLDKGEVQAVLSETEIAFPKVVAVRDRDILTASGGIRFDGTFYGKASSAKVNLSNFDLLMNTGLPVKGSVSVSVTGKGSFDEPDISGSFGAYRLYYKDADLGEGALDVRIKDGVLSGGGAVLGEKVHIDGSLWLDTPYRWKGRVTFDEGRFEPFVKVVYKALPDDVSLISTGVLTAEGALDEPAKTAVAFDFTKVSADIMGRRLDNVGDIGLSYKGGALAIKSMKLKGEDVDIDVSGGAESLEHMNINIAAQADLGALKKPLEDYVDFIDGVGKAKVSLQGDIKDPTISGKVSVAGAGLKFRDFPQKFDNISAGLDMDNGGFTLDGLKAELGGGTVTVSGKGALKGFKVDNFSFKVGAQDVKLRYPENLNVTVDAALYAEGADKHRSIEGEITVKKARYSERIDWKSWLLQFQKGRKETVAGTPGRFDDTALDLHITGKESIKIDNNIAKVPVTPDLNVRGTIARPVLMGRLEASSGQVFFRNNEFRLINGVAEFADPTKMDPLIDLQAETRVKEYLIQLTLSGTMERLKVTLLSDPPLEDADIMTLLTVGRTTEALRGHETAITTGEAASFVTGQIQDAVEERVRRVTGFDRFQIDPYLTSTGASSGPRLTIGKSLFSDKFYITYSSNLGTSEEQFVRLEYKVNNNLSVVAERDELGRVGGDVKYRFEFK